MKFHVRIVSRAVGQTGRTLKKRIVEHKATVKKEDNKNGIAVHVKNTKHHIDWDGARVISNEMQNWQRRVFLFILAIVLVLYCVNCSMGVSLFLTLLSF